MTLNSTLSYLKTWKFWYELVLMTLGSIVVVGAVYYFLVPSKLIVATIAAFGIVLDTLLGNTLGVTVGVSFWVFILNVILLVIGFLLIGKEFGAKTVYTSLIQGPAMKLMETFFPYTRLYTEPGQISVMNDIWLDLLCFVLLLSIAQAILFRINASSGGLDIIAKIVSKYCHMDIGAAVAASGFFICLSAFLINPFRLVIIGFIGTWINGVVVDYFMTSLNRKKRVCIISDENERIRQFIVNELVRGCSIYEVTGGFSQMKHTEIEVLLTNEEFAYVMEYIKNHDIDAFITAGNVSEVYGKWFSHNSKHYKNIKK